MTKWEYKTLNEYQQDFKLNAVGQERWELVNHSVVNRTGTWDSGTLSHYYLFKRPIIE